MDVPNCIQELSKIPGVDWVDEDTAWVKDWWCQRRQLQRVWFSAARYLGKGVSAQDVEDAVVEFYVLFDQVLRSYKPGGPDFCYYLMHICYKNQCIKTGDRLRKVRNQETSLDVALEGNTLSLELADGRIAANPGRRAQNTAFLEEVAAFLNNRRLPETQRQVFVMRYLEEMSYDEIAEKMGKPLGSIKGWLNRATHAARLFLTERGWSECQAEM